jgi:ABC-type transport system involved in multi-copper enzyme maturation permease subunit
MSLLIASIILELSKDISILLPEFYPSFLIILGVSLVYLLTMVILGVLISGTTRKPIISMIVSLFVWVIIVLALPKVSPMLARIIYPVEAEQVVNLRKQMALEDIEKTFKQESIEIHNKYLQQIPEKLINEYFGIKRHGTESAFLESKYKSVVPLDKELIALAQENNKRIANEIGQIAQNHKNRMNIQNTIAMYISRLSPACCYSYLISGLSNTGTRENDQLMENAQKFQDQVKTAIYDKYQRRVWKIGGITSFGGTRLHEFPETVPDMQYRHSSLTEILEAGLVDMILSFGFAFLFFTLAFVTFNKYDVRP